MDDSRSTYHLLKIFIAIGGVFELVMGIVVLLWGDMIVSIATDGYTIPNYALYWRTMGLLAATLGSLQIVAYRDPQKYIVIPLSASFVRLLLPLLTIPQIFDTPSMTLVLVASTAFDFFLAVSTVFLIHSTGLFKRIMPSSSP